MGTGDCGGKTELSGWKARRTPLVIVTSRNVRHSAASCPPKIEVERVCGWMPQKKLDRAKEPDKARLSWTF
jgi:hypothetical protein